MSSLCSKSVTYSLQTLVNLVRFNYLLTLWHLILSKKHSIRIYTSSMRNRSQTKSETSKKRSKSSKQTKSNSRKLLKVEFWSLKNSWRRSLAVVLSLWEKLSLYLTPTMMDSLQSKTFSSTLLTRRKSTTMIWRSLSMTKTARNKAGSTTQIFQGGLEAPFIWARVSILDTTQ